MQMNKCSSWMKLCMPLLLKIMIVISIAINHINVAWEVTHASQVGQEKNVFKHYIKRNVNDFLDDVCSVHIVYLNCLCSSGVWDVHYH